MTFRKTVDWLSLYIRPVMEKYKVILIVEARGLEKQLLQRNWQFIYRHLFFLLDDIGLPCRRPPPWKAILICMFSCITALKNG